MINGGIIGTGGTGGTVSGGYHAIDVTEIPNSNTLTYIDDNGEIQPFLPGMEARYKVTDASGYEHYQFYKLYEIRSERYADWKLQDYGTLRVKVITNVSRDNDNPDMIFLNGNIGSLTIERWDGEMWLHFDTITINENTFGNWQTIWLPAGTKYRIANPGNIDVSHLDSERRMRIEGFYGLAKNIEGVIASNATDTHELLFTGERLKVNLSADNESSIQYPQSMRVFIISVDGKEWIGDYHKPVGDEYDYEYVIPYGVKYLIEPANWALVDYGSYIPPTTLHLPDTGGNMVYREVNMHWTLAEQSTITLDQTIAAPASISGDINSGEIAQILSQIKRVAMKVASDGSVYYCPLQADNSKYFHDGTLKNDVIDTMVYIPRFCYSFEFLDDDQKKIKFTFSRGLNAEMATSVNEVQPCLIGAYQGVVSEDKLYSVTNATVTVGLDKETYNTAAKNRGNGFHLTSLYERSVLQLLYMAKYGTRDVQPVLGPADGWFVPFSKTGTLDSTGNNDSTPNGSHLIKFAGLENILGMYWEIAGESNVTNLGGLNYQRWDFKYPAPGGNIGQIDWRDGWYEGSPNDGWASSIASTHYSGNSVPHMCIPMETNGSSSTHYASYVTVSKESPASPKPITTVLTGGIGPKYAVSDSPLYSYGWLTFDVSHPEDFKSLDVTARLSYHGVMTEVLDVQQFLNKIA